MDCLKDLRVSYYMILLPGLSEKSFVSFMVKSNLRGLSGKFENIDQKWHESNQEENR